MPAPNVGRMENTVRVTSKTSGENSETPQCFPGLLHDE